MADEGSLAPAVKPKRPHQTTRLDRWWRRDATAIAGRQQAVYEDSICKRKIYGNSFRSFSLSRKLADGGVDINGAEEPGLAVELPEYG